MWRFFIASTVLIFRSSSVAIWFFGTSVQQSIDDNDVDDNDNADDDDELTSRDGEWRTKWDGSKHN